MNDYLKRACERFKDKEELITPISKVDAEILTEIYEISKKMNLTELSTILSKHKYLKDQEILDKLLEYNIKLTSEIAKQSERLDKEGNLIPIVIRYLRVNNQTIDLFQIVGHFSIDRETEEGVEYQLILNPTPEKSKFVPYYANEALVFKTEKERNEISEKLDVYLSVTRGYFLP